MTERVDFKTTYVAMVEADQAAEFERAVREPEPLDFETAASWRALRPRFERRRWHFPPALAAVLLMAVVGSSGWFLGRQMPSADARRPRPNTAIVDLVEDASRRAVGGEPQEIAAADGGTVLVLTPDAVPDFPAYEIRILDAGGAPVLTVPGLELQPVSETFQLSLPADSLAAGDYRFELWGSGDSGEPIAAYRIRWVRASRSSAD